MSLPPPDADILTRELAPGEWLLWVGRPPQGLDLRADDGAEAISVLGTELLMLAFAAGFGGPVLAVINGLITAAAGTRAFHRLWTVPRRRRRTWYGLTADRLLVAVAGVGVGSVPLAGVARVEVEERADGSGVVRVGGSEPRAADLAVLELATGARAVYELVRTAGRETGRTVAEPAAAHSP